jgi:hypothetical protein
MKKFGGLSTWIFIALFIGIGVGYALNVSYPAPAQKTKKEALELLSKEPVSYTHLTLPTSP